jgi:adenine C2-methylase RlmN of 23S rRNA A2503 and tRNA A37
MATGETLHLSASSATISPSNPSAIDELALDPLSSVDCRLSLTASFDATRARETLMKVAALAN